MSNNVFKKTVGSFLLVQVIVITLNKYSCPTNKNLDLKMRNCNSHGNIFS